MVDGIINNANNSFPDTLHVSIESYSFYDEHLNDL